MAIISYINKNVGLNCLVVGLGDGGLFCGKIQRNVGLLESMSSIYRHCFFFIVSVQTQSEFIEKVIRKTKSEGNENLNLTETTERYIPSFSLTCYEATFVLAKALHNTCEGKLFNFLSERFALCWSFPLYLAPSPLC